MRQSGHYQSNEILSKEELTQRIYSTIDELDINLARKEVEPFIPDPVSLDLWSKFFFKQAAQRIIT